PRAAHFPPLALHAALPISRRFVSGPLGGRRRGRAVVLKHDIDTFDFSTRHPALAVVFNDGAPRLPRHVRHRRVRPPRRLRRDERDRKSTRLNFSHVSISYA